MEARWMIEARDRSSGGRSVALCVMTAGALLVCGGVHAEDQVSLSPTPIEAVRALRAENEALRAEVVMLKDSNEDLRAALARLAEDVAALKDATGYNGRSAMKRFGHALRPD
jgi:hypothetical protein